MEKNVVCGETVNDVIDFLTITFCIGLFCYYLSGIKDELYNQKIKLYIAEREIQDLIKKCEKLND